MPRSKFTAANRAAIIKSVRKGNFVVTACRALGIHEGSYYRWLNHGKDAIAKEEEGYKLTVSEKAYAQFLVDVERADAESEMELLAKVERLAEDKTGDWRGLWEVMQRRHNRRWARERNAVTVEMGEGSASKGLEIKLSFEPPERQTDTGDRSIQEGVA